MFTCTESASPDSAKEQVRRAVISAAMNVSRMLVMI